MLSDKYAPRKTSTILGAGEQAARIKTWLRGWEKNKDRAPRALLLSGPPGVGKTVLIERVAHEEGFHVTSLDASDARGAKALGAKLRSVTHNGTLANKKNKHLVLVDEVDAMDSSASDRGGLSELLGIIRKTRVPIVTICNDRTDRKLRALRGLCLDVRRPPVDPGLLLRFAKHVCRQEGIRMSDADARSLVERVGSDVRQLLVALDMQSRSRSKGPGSAASVGTADAAKDSSTALATGDFGVTRAILDKRGSLIERCDAFLSSSDTYTMVPFFVHQNFVQHLGHPTTPHALSTTSRAVSDSDVVSASMRGRGSGSGSGSGSGGGHWDLLPVHAAMIVRVGSLLVDSPGRGRHVSSAVEFPRMLGNIGKQNRRMGMLPDLSRKVVRGPAPALLAPSTFRTDYLPFIAWHHLFEPLLSGPEGVETARRCVSTLDRLGLTRDDLFEVLPLFRVGDSGSLATAVPTRTKSAVTRLFNQKNKKNRNTNKKENKKENKKNKKEERP